MARTNVLLFARHSEATSFPYGGFAYVMATGIVSIAAGLEGLAVISNGLFIVNLFGFSVLIAALAARFCSVPCAAASELLGSTGPTSLTLVAACCVLGNEIALTSAHESVVDAFCAAAVLLWIGIVYALVVRTTTRQQKPGVESVLDGTWLLIVVATEGIAILITRVSPALASDEVKLFVALALFFLGAAFYAVLIGLIVARWFFLPLRPEQLTPPYWINMGAVAITTLAGTRLLATMGSDPLLSQLRQVVLAVTILLWTIASWWIPLLIALTLWRYRSGAPLRYRLDSWAIVFPLGMYTTATWRLAHDTGLPFLAPVPDAFVWVALAARSLAFIGMTRAGLRGRLSSTG